MATPIWQLQRELQYAQARQAYYSDTTRELKTTVDAQPRMPVVYYPLFLRTGAIAPPLKLFASAKSVTQFGGAAALGLVEDPDTVAAAENPSRGFEPSKINMMIGDTTPTPKRAYNGTGRRYIKYSRTSTGDAQAHFTAPLSSGTTAPTVALIEDKVAAIKTAKGTDAQITAYGRIWFELEKYRKSVA